MADAPEPGVRRGRTRHGSWEIYQLQVRLSRYTDSQSNSAVHTASTLDSTKKALSFICFWRILPRVR
jgi:hypothetical protein